ncbi:MAG: type II toxin-antitoxin system RelE/ParE family toxin [Burkholderiales bacterium]
MCKSMTWKVVLHDEFDSEFVSFSEDVQDNLLAAAKAIQIAGPKAGRPHVDTLAGSKHANMKELRFNAHDGREVWRAAFAFDPRRDAIVLVAGEKQGRNQKLFYKRLIKVADARFDSHLQHIEKSK